MGHQTQPEINTHHSEVHRYPYQGRFQQYNQHCLQKMVLGQFYILVTDHGYNHFEFNTIMKLNS